MYGTIFKMKPKEGKEDEIIALFKEWESNRKPHVKGAKIGYLFKLDNGGMMGVAVFDNKEDYLANADSTEQDSWYQKLRENLEEDPEWNDGEILGTMDV